MLLLLGIWLITNPFTLGLTAPTIVGEGVAQITAERDLAPIATRATALAWSDTISGFLLILFGVLSLNPRRIWSSWAACLIGIWLLFAPLVLWAPTAAAFANDTFVGGLVIALTILIPGVPGMALYLRKGPEIPPGWTYNPSSWFQRIPVITLAFVGFFGARYLAAYQFGFITRVWDPFFGDGTEMVLDSDVSLAWPISDAGLGMVAYSLEALIGFLGGTSRWRTMPWMVLLFGILVVPLGLVSITLVILQPVAVGAWCTICLITALAMLIMIPLALDEVAATLQFLIPIRRRGEFRWRTLFWGDTIVGGSEDERSPSFDAPVRVAGSAMIWGVTVPWNLFASAALGTWLMFSPSVFGTFGSPMAHSDHLVGALVTVVAVIAMAEVARAARFLNIVAGAWIVAAPWLLSGATPSVAWHDVLVGVLLILLSLRRGPVRERYGNWQRFIRL